MTTFYLHDGQNETGPFSIEELKKQRLTRNTPLRVKDTDKWMPAEKVSELKPLLVPRKIRRPKDVIPVVAHTVSDLHQRKPIALYGGVLAVALLAGLSYYSIKKTGGTHLPEATSPKEVSGRSVLDALEPTPQSARVHAEISNNTEAPKPEPPKVDAAKVSRLRWNKLIRAANSNYGIGLLGGIKDLSVIVTNHSDFPLDEVIAKVTYIKASGDVWKTVPITLYAVPAHETKEQSVPDVSRAKKVKVSLAKVVSKKMKFSYSEGRKGKDAGDPYYKE